MGFPDFDEFIRRILAGIEKQFRLMALIENKIRTHSLPNFEDELPLIAEIFSMGGRKILSPYELKEMNDSFYSNKTISFIDRKIWNKARNNYKKFKEIEEKLDIDGKLIGHLAMLYQMIYLTMAFSTENKNYIFSVLDEFSDFIDNLDKGKFPVFEGKNDSF